MDFRMYDNALGRFYGMDALSEKNHYLSPFQFGNGNPIYYSDPSGLTALKNEAHFDSDIRTGNEEMTRTALIGNYGLDFGGGGGGAGRYGSGDVVGGTMQDLLNSIYKEMNRLGVNSYSINRNSNGIFWATYTQNDTNYESGMDWMGASIISVKFDFGNTDYHNLSKSLRKYSGYALAINKPLELAFRSGTMYPSQLYPSHTSNVVFQKNILGKKIHIPLGEYRTSSIGKASKFFKTTGRLLGAAAVISGGISIYNEGLNISNGLDTAMALLAVSPTGVGQAIAGVYFLSNTISILTTGKDIGQHIQDQIDGN